MRSTSTFPELGRMAALALVAVALAGAARAQPFPVLAGDPVDVASGRAFAILPGVPLVLPQANGKYDPPIVVAGTIGDVDLVIRAGTPTVGPGMPAPATVLPVAMAGGTHVVDGTDVPFTVVVSDAAGVPLSGNEMDGLPVIVFAFADLDGDGFVGPTTADAAGALDDTRERQESDFVVGRTAAIFTNGVARGTVAVWRGAPASSGGLRVVLTAAAYVGPFSANFLLGNVPDGPPIATLLPFFPRFDPDRVVESGGRGGPAGPEVRLGVALEAAFDPPVDDPVLGTPFALPTDGSNPTIDRAVVQSGAASRVRFVAPSVAAGFPVGVQTALLPGAGGALFEPLPALTVPDDGPGGTVHARLVPVDVFDNVTDPPPGFMATLVAGPGIRIVAPDADADPTTETITVGSAAGVEVELDDAGAAGDGPAASALTVLRDGLPVDALAVTLGPGGTTTTTTTGTPVTSTSTPAGPTTTTTLGSGNAPVIGAAAIVGDRTTFSVGCHATRTLLATVSDPDGDVAYVTASVVLVGAPPITVPLAAATSLPGVVLPPDAFAGVLDVDPSAAGLAAITFEAGDAAGHTATPVALSVPIAASVAPAVGVPTVSPAAIPASVRTNVTLGARAGDDCGLKRVLLEIDRGKGFRKFARLRDDGRHGDATAADGVYGATKRVKLPAGTIALRTTARNKRRVDATSPAVTVQIVP